MASKLTQFQLGNLLASSACSLLLMAQSSQRCEFNDRTKEGCLNIFFLFKTDIDSENVPIEVVLILLICLSPS